MIENVTWQEIAGTCGLAYSCPRRGSKIVIRLSEYVTSLSWQELEEELNKLLLMFQRIRGVYDYAVYKSTFYLLTYLLWQRLKCQRKNVGCV